MGIIQIIEHFDAEANIAKLAADTKISGLLNELPKGTLSENEFNYVIQYFVQTYLVSKLVENNINRNYRSVTNQPELIELKFMITLKYEEMLDNLATTVAKLDLDKKTQYHAAKEKLDYYFGDHERQPSAAVTMLRYFGNQVLDLFYAFKRKADNLDSLKQSVISSSKTMYSQYREAHDSIDNLPALVSSRKI